MVMLLVSAICLTRYSKASRTVSGGSLAIISMTISVGVPRQMRKLLFLKNTERGSFSVPVAKLGVSLIAPWWVRSGLELSS